MTDVQLRLLAAQEKDRRTFKENGGEFSVLSPRAREKVLQKSRPRFM